MIFQPVMPDRHYIPQAMLSSFRHRDVFSILRLHLHRSPVPTGIDGRIDREIRSCSNRTPDEENSLFQRSHTLAGGKPVGFQIEHDSAITAVGNPAHQSGAVVVVFIRRAEFGMILQCSQPRQTPPVPQRHDLQILIPLPQQLEHATRSMAPKFVFKIGALTADHPPGTHLHGKVEILPPVNHEITAEEITIAGELPGIFPSVPARRSAARRR